MEPDERLKAMASTKMSAMREKLVGSAPSGSRVRVDQATAEAALKDWPDTPRRVGEDMMKRYGAPNEISHSHMVWYNNGPWKRSVLFRDEIPHNFPTPHTDFLMQFIDYRVPPERVSDVAIFDGSVIVDRTAGEVGARCDMESMNFLSLNLLNEIMTGKLSVDEARKKYAEEASAHVLNRPAPYTEKLVFQVPQGETADLDESVIGGAMMHQAGEKMKDVAKGDTSGDEKWTYQGPTRPPFVQD